MTEQNREADLTLDDIKLAVQLIDVASIRGAIRGEEMAAVGVLRGRFTAFLGANTPVPEATEEASAE